MLDFSLLRFYVNTSRHIMLLIR